MLLLLVTTGSVRLNGINLTDAATDTLKTHLTTIDINEIPVESSELKIKLKHQLQELISDDEIRRFRVKNDVIVADIGKDLIASIDSIDGSKGILHLENRQIKLQQEKRKIEEQKTFLTEIIQNIDQFKIHLTQESERWKETKNTLGNDSLAASVTLIKLGETISFLDSSLAQVSQKNKALLNILDHTIESGAEIDAQFDKNKALIRNKENGVFRRDHLPLFKAGFKSGFVNEMRKSISNILSIYFEILKDYMSSQGDALLLTLLALSGLIYLFFIIKKNVKIKESGYGSFYKSMLIKVLSHPLSASAILTLFFTFFIFPDRPWVFREITLYLMAFPLIRILSLILDRKYHNYIYAFGIVIFISIFLVLIPAEFFIYRILLLLISAAEIALLTMFLLHFDKKHALHEQHSKLIYFFVILHLTLAVIGFISNMTGRIVLTEIVVAAVFYNLFYGLVLFITALLLNGLVATGVDTRKGQQLNIFSKHGELIKQKTIYTLNIIASGIWVVLMLKNFRILDVIFSRILSIFTHEISIGSARFSLDVFVIFFAVIYISVMLSRIIRIVLEEDILNRVSLSKGLPHTIAMLVSYALITAGFFLAVNAAGIPVDKLTIILGAMSVGIGFGLQNIFNNLVSGLILLFERPIQLGDTVQVGQLTGNVKTIGLRSSNIKTFDGAEVIVPNGQLISNEVINWTLSDKQRRLEIAVGVDYASDPQMVRALLSEILENNADVLKEPSSAVFFNGLGESSLDFVLLFWIDDYNEGRRIKSEILFAIFEVLKTNNIKIPFPQRDVHLRSVDREIVISNKDAEK